MQSYKKILLVICGIIIVWTGAFLSYKTKSIQEFIKPKARNAKVLGVYESKMSKMALIEVEDYIITVTSMDNRLGVPYESLKANTEITLQINDLNLPTKDSDAYKIIILACIVAFPLCSILTGILATYHIMTGEL